MTTKRVTFIGMAGVGKSSIGKKIASLLKIPFIDGDVIIESTLKTSLTTLIKNEGPQSFLKLENTLLSTYNFPNHYVFSPGGSIVYCKDVMTYIKKNTLVIYLEDSLENIKNRVSNYHKRGIISPKNQSLEETFNERKNLYAFFADKTYTLPTPFHADKIYKDVLRLME